MQNNIQSNQKEIETNNTRGKKESTIKKCNQKTANELTERSFSIPGGR